MSVLKRITTNMFMQLAKYFIKLTNINNVYNY